MDLKQYIAAHESICKLARELSERKNADYSAPDLHVGDPMALFKNFLNCENLGICSAEDGILVRLSDKFQRLVNVTRPGRSAKVSESELDTVLDIINYTILWHLLRVVKHDEQTKDIKEYAELP